MTNAAGEFVAECLNPDGSVAWREVFRNGTTTAGCDHANDVVFGGGSQVSTWYLGLIDGATAPTLDPGDTAAAHSGWTENTSYSGNRPAWSVGASSGGIISNAGNRASYTFTANVQLWGAFLASSATKGSTSDVVYSTGLFTARRDVLNTQTLRITYRHKLFGS